MTNFNPTFLKRLKDLGLSHNEHLALRERLAAYADLHPGIAAPATANGFFVFLSTRRFATYAFSFLLVLGVTGGVAAASEGSVPGEALYSIKIHVNEPLMTALAATNVDQAKVAAKIATRRADEAVTLASRGELSAQNQQYLSQEFTKSVAKAADRANKLAESGDTVAAANVQADFAANLAGEAQALGALSNSQTDGQRAATEKMLATVVSTSESVAPDDAGAATAVTVSAVANEDAASTTLTESEAASSTGALKNRSYFRTRFAQHLHVTASTTLKSIFQSQNISNFKTDTAIPAQTTEGGDQNDQLDVRVSE